MRRMLTISGVAVLFVFTTSSAFAQSSLNLQIGGFVPNGSQTVGGTVINDGAAGDVLAADIPFLDFQKTDFNGPTVNGEWLIGVGNNIEAGRSERTAITTAHRTGAWIPRNQNAMPPRDPWAIATTRLPSS